jgi:hypothetical protein
MNTDLNSEVIPSVTLAEELPMESILQREREIHCHDARF